MVATMSSGTPRLALATEGRLAASSAERGAWSYGWLRSRRLRTRAAPPAEALRTNSDMETQIGLCSKSRSPKPTPRRVPARVARIVVWVVVAALEVGLHVMLRHGHSPF